MAKRQSYTINGEFFKTKKALQERIREILWSYDLDAVLTWFDFEFMTEVLRNHPHADTKFGVGLSHMYVKQNPVYTQTRGFWLVRTDGSETDFSYLECIRPSTQMSKFRSACRVAIEPDTQKFKQAFFDECGGVATCPFTGEAITYTSSHVDHVPPKTFDKLLSDFVSEKDLDIESVQFLDDLEDGRIQTELANSALFWHWVNYHNEYAELRVISRTANLSHVKVQEVTHE